MGEWDLRSLVGHPSIALSSAGAYLKAPAEREDVASAADYYALVHKFASSAEATTGNEEAGRRAGIELGVDPAAAIDSLVEHALSDLAGAEDQRSRVAGGVGIRLSSYVSTRTFELAVHRLDIARAAGVPFTLRHWTCQHAVTVANRVAVDVQACGCNQTDPAAVAIVGQIAAKLADR